MPPCCWFVNKGYKKKCLKDFRGVNSLTGWPFVQDNLMIGVNSVWQAVMAVFHTFHLSCKDIMGSMLAALRRLLFNLLPLLEVFRPLIYLFILIIVFFSPCLLANFSLRWIESGESWLVVLSGVVIHLARAIHQYPHSVLTGLHLSLRSHKNQLISPAKRSIFFYDGFLWFYCTSWLEAKDFCNNHSALQVKNDHIFVQIVLNCLDWSL